IVDATIVSAASSTKNSTGQRDPEMHQTRKGNQWYFGMKAHVGSDAESGLVHSVIGTAANVADVTQAHNLLHGEETAACGDAGYTGVGKQPERKQAVDWHVAMKPGKRRALGKTKVGRLCEKIERLRRNPLLSRQRVSEVLCDRGARGELTIGEGPRQWQSSRK